MPGNSADVKSKIDVLEVEIDGLKEKLKDWEVKCEAEEFGTDKWKYYDRQVTRIDRQLSETRQQLHDAIELLKHQAPQAPSTGTSLCFFHVVLSFVSIVFLFYE